MDISRGKFIGLFTGFVGLAAIANSPSAIASECEGPNLNHLIPEYGEQNLVRSTSRGLGKIGETPLRMDEYRTESTSLRVLYVGEDRFAINIIAPDNKISFTLYDGCGDHIFRKIYGPNEIAPTPNWIRLKYAKKIKT